MMTNVFVELEAYETEKTGLISVKVFVFLTEFRLKLSQFSSNTASVCPN